MEKPTDKSDALPSSKSSAASVHDGDVQQLSQPKGGKADIALDFLEKKGDTSIIYTEEQQKRVLRKIDMRLMPLMFTSYMIQYMDKSVLPQAAIYGLLENINLNGQDYSWSM